MGPSIFFSCLPLSRSMLFPFPFSFLLLSSSLQIHASPFPFSFLLYSFYFLLLSSSLQIHALPVPLIFSSLLLLFSSLVFLSPSPCFEFVPSSFPRHFTSLFPTFKPFMAFSFTNDTQTQQREKNVYKK